jgi:hypothetical protein
LPSRNAGRFPAPPARHPADRRRRHPAQLALAAVTVALAAVTFAASVAAAPAEPPSPGAQPLQIRLDLPRGGEPPSALFVRLRSIADTAEDRELEIELAAGQPPAVDLASSGEWELCAWSAGFWSECRRFVAETGDDPLLVPVELWRSGRVEGTLVHPAPANPAASSHRGAAGDPPSAPEWVRVEFAPTGDHLIRTGAGATAAGTPPSTAAPLPESEALCRLEAAEPADERPAATRWSCAVPAGRLDLEVRPAGYVPGYHWGVTVPPGGEVDLGTMTLVEGSSVAGSVTVEDADLDPRTAQVFLTPAIAPGADRAVGQELSEIRYRGEIGPRGFFQITGVPAGTYVVHAEQPGLAPGYLGPVEVWEESESVLQEPVVLRRPLPLTVEVAPATDWLGGRWKIALTPATEVGGRIDTADREEAVTGDAGTAVFPALAPGLYTLQVYDSSGQSFHFDRNVRLETPADSPHRVEVPMVFLEGRVLLGDEPLAATLWFGGRHGARQAELVSDEEGELVGALPRPGRWRVAVESPEEGISNRVRVEVEPDRRGNAEILIELPDTRAFGSVVDESGHPIAGAEVHLQSAGEAADNVTGRDGSFELRAFEPGTVSLLARKDAGNDPLHSDTRLLAVAEDQHVGPVELVLRSVRTLHGRVESPVGAPIPGAVVDVSTHRPLGTTYLDSVRSALDGTFSVRVREGSEVLQATVAAPGHPLTVLAVAPEEPLRLRTAADVGELVIEVAKEAGEEGFRPIVFHGELSIPPATLTRWARSQSVPVEPATGLRIPSMAAGPYRVCLATMAGLATALYETGSFTPALVACEAGFLAPGGELVLEVAPPETR